MADLLGRGRRDTARWLLRLATAFKCAACAAPVTYLLDLSASGNLQWSQGFGVTAGAATTRGEDPARRLRRSSPWAAARAINSTKRPPKSPVRRGILLRLGSSNAMVAGPTL